MMYVELKTGIIDGAEARIGWLTFSKTGKSIYYRGRTLIRARGIAGNYIDADSGEEFWVSGVKKSGSNVHPAGRMVKVVIDEDASEEYDLLRSHVAGKQR